MVRKIIHSTSTHAEKQPFSIHNGISANEKSMHYFFFNSEETAEFFHPQHIKGPHLVYVTSTPLDYLFNLLNAGLGKNHTTHSSYSLHTRHCEANGTSTTYHKPTEKHPEHLSLYTHHPSQLEEIIGHLREHHILLTLLDNLSVKGH